MVRIILTVAVFLCASSVFAQGMFGAEVGAGKTTVGKSYLTPTIKGYYLRKFTRTWYLGAELAYERYSFRQSYNGSAVTPANESIISIRQWSGYTFLSPLVDIGIGFRKYIHLHASFGLGLLTDANQRTNVTQQYTTAPPKNFGYDTVSLYTTYNVPVLASRFSIGISERIPTNGYWNIVLSQEYSTVPTNLTNYGPRLRANYFAFTVGIMHKYPMVLVEY